MFCLSMCCFIIPVIVQLTMGMMVHLFILLFQINIFVYIFLLPIKHSLVDWSRISAEKRPNIFCYRVHCWMRASHSNWFQWHYCINALNRCKPCPGGYKESFSQTVLTETVDMKRELYLEDNSTPTYTPTMIFKYNACCSKHHSPA